MGCDAMIYGRKTYDGFAAVWPRSMTRRVMRAG